MSNRAAAITAGVTCTLSLLFLCAVALWNVLVGFPEPVPDVWDVVLFIDMMTIIVSGLAAIFFYDRHNSSS